MFLGGRVRSPEPRASVLRRAHTPTSDGGGAECPPVRGRVLPAGLGSVYVVRRGAPRWTRAPDGVWPGVPLRAPEGVHARRRCFQKTSQRSPRAVESRFNRSRRTLGSIERGNLKKGENKDSQHGRAIRFYLHRKSSK